MKPAKYIIFIFVVFFNLSCYAHALTVTAHVDQNHISTQDAVFLQVEVDAGDARVDVSHIKDFKVTSRGTSSVTQIINGRIERKKTCNYMLLPLKEGLLTIPPITAEYKNESAKSEAIKIKVVKEAVEPGQAKTFFSTAQLSAEKVYLGQPVIYTLKFYNSKQIAGLGFETPPGFDGLNAKPFEKEKSYTRRISGVLYQVTEVNYLIIPSTPGQFAISPAVLIAKVVVRDSGRSGFDSFFNDSFFSRQQTRPVRVDSQPVTLNVKALPLYGGKEAFSGLVGKFDIKAQADKRTIKAGESITLSIEISGSGNIMDAGLPELNLDEENFKIYDDSPTEDIRLTPQGYEGKKIFKKAVVPINPGKFTLPSIGLTYFDVGNEDYHTVRTESITLDVQPSQEMMMTQKQVQPTLPSARMPKEVSLINKDILEIKEGLDVLEDHRHFGALAFWGWLLLPGILFSGVRVFALVSGREINNEKAMMKKARMHLKQAMDARSSDPEFWSSLHSAITALVLARGNLRSESLTCAETRDILQQHQVPQPDIDAVIECLEEIQAVRFGGKTFDEKIKEAAKVKASDIFKRLCVLLAFMSSFFLFPSTVKATPSQHYFEALKSYQSGDFKKAAEQFEAIARSPIKNAQLYFNIGNAYLKAGDIGRAILWYERSKKISPRDPDLEYNLKFARNQVKDRVEKNLELKDVIIFWDNLVGLKALQILAIISSSVFFSWAAARTFKKKAVFSGTGSLLFSLFVLATLVTTISMVRLQHSSEAVVVDEKIVVRSGILENATDLFTLHAGSKVEIKEKKEGFYKVAFSTDKIGWVSNKGLELI